VGWEGGGEAAAAYIDSELSPNRLDRASRSLLKVSSRWMSFASKLAPPFSKPANAEDSFSTASWRATMVKLQGLRKHAPCILTASKYFFHAVKHKN
jgi:hypothetical protein